MNVSADDLRLLLTEGYIGQDEEIDVEGYVVLARDLLELVEDGLEVELTAP